MIDTHSHIYSEEFEADREEMIQRAKNAGVKKVILPNVDKDTLPAMLALEKKYQGFCFAAIGAHPECIKSGYEEEISLVKSELERRKFIAIGEIGIDLYWDKTFFQEQIIAFQTQVEWALEYNLPVIIHIRNSHTETMEALKPYKDRGLRGVFHCFGGSLKEAQEIFGLGDFYLGIGGVVTFKNSGLAETLKQIPIENLLLETDSPYLAPVPNRGKRNEPAYLTQVVKKLEEIYSVSAEKVKEITTSNAEKLFFS